MINKTQYPKILGHSFCNYVSFIAQMFTEYFLCVHIVLGAGTEVLNIGNLNHHK